MSRSGDGIVDRSPFGRQHLGKQDLQDVVLKKEVRLLRALVEALLLASARGESINLDNADVRLLLGLAENAGSDEILQRLMQVRAPVTGRVECSNCGGALQQREGMETVECHWCGTTVSFEPEDAPTQEY